MAQTRPRPFSRPFSRLEWIIAWRYLRARRAEGGVAVMTWISLIGITLAVFALIATLAVRAGFRAEFVDTILGADAHVRVLTPGEQDASGRMVRGFPDYAALAKKISAIPGVVSAAPTIRGQVMVSTNEATVGALVYGMSLDDLRKIRRIAEADQHAGSLDNYDRGIAIGSGIARDLSIGVGDKVRLISPQGVKTAFGVTPRVKAYTVTYIFTAGRYDIDNTRIYMPFAEAQSFFDKEGFADEIDVDVTNPDQVDNYAKALYAAAGPGASLWTWKQASSAFLRALTVEDNVMFVILSIIVLVATLNITSGLIMLVKNKGRDIGILRTMGLTEGQILRVFFLCGALTGILGTAAGVVLGCLFAIYIDPIFSMVNYWAGGGVWNPSIYGIYHLPAKLQLHDVLSAVTMSLVLSFVVTVLPARRAARLNPVEALRYE